MNLNVNNKYRNSVFTTLFGEPTTLLELYNALSGKNLSPDTPIEINTLTDILYMEKMNDVSFMVDDKFVVLIEHQSTKNLNMPLRFLMYIARVYEKMVDKKAVYKNKQIKIPMPEFWVLYNGREPYPEETKLELSESFTDGPHDKQLINLELTVKVLNINPGFNDVIRERSKNLNGYVTFISKVSEYELQENGLEDAISKALQFCTANGILVEFLNDHAVEVINMLMTEFNMETALEVRGEEKFADGLAEGLVKGKIEMLRSMLAAGLSAEQVQKIVKEHGISEEDYNRIKMSFEG